MHKPASWQSSLNAIACVSLQQCAAAADPKRPTRELARRSETTVQAAVPHGAANRPPIRKTRSLGNFNDFDQLFEQLAKAPVMELGNPLPKNCYLPRTPVGSCPAAHNRALLGEEPD